MLIALKVHLFPFFFLCWHWALTHQKRIEKYLQCVRVSGIQASRPDASVTQVRVANQLLLEVDTNKLQSATPGAIKLSLLPGKAEKMEPFTALFNSKESELCREWHVQEVRKRNTIQTGLLI